MSLPSTKRVLGCAAVTILLDVVVKSLMERSHHRGTTIVSASGPAAATSVVVVAAVATAATADAAVAALAVNKLVAPVATVDDAPVKSRLRGFHSARSARFVTLALDLSGATNATPLLHTQQVKSNAKPRIFGQEDHVSNEARFRVLLAAVPL